MTALSNIKFRLRIDRKVGRFNNAATTFYPPLTAERVGEEIALVLMEDAYARGDEKVWIEVRVVPGQDVPERVDMGNKFGNFGITNHV